MTAEEANYLWCVWCVGVEVWGVELSDDFQSGKEWPCCGVFPTGRALLAELSIGTSSARSSYR